jgi:hypothetical protein
MLEWIVLIVLVLLLLGAFAPRAGWYGTANPVWDILGLVILVIVVIWLLRIFGVLA